MKKAFDLKKKTNDFHAERADFKNLVTTPKGADAIVSEIERNITTVISGMDCIDYLNSMCQVSASFLALKEALHAKNPKLLLTLRDHGFKYRG